MDIGDKVVFTNRLAHEEMPQFYPKVGTIGTVVLVGDADVWVKWPDGSTSGRDVWYAGFNSVSLSHECEDLEFESPLNICDLI